MNVIENVFDMKLMFENNKIVCYETFLHKLYLFELLVNRYWCVEWELGRCDTYSGSVGKAGALQ